jgi:ParB-like chromosome segregation protein Spo0J
MEIREVPIEDIKPAEYNPRQDLRPGDADYEALRRSVETFDLVAPLVWNQRSGNLVGGHQRLKVLREGGATTVAVSVVDLDPAEEKVLNVALNRIRGEWDYPKLKDLLLVLDTGAVDITLTGFEMAEIEDLMTQVYVPGGEEMPEELPEIAPFGVEGRFLLVFRDAEEEAFWRERIGAPGDPKGEYSWGDVEP